MYRSTPWEDRLAEGEILRVDEGEEVVAGYLVLTPEEVLYAFGDSATLERLDVSDWLKVEELDADALTDVQAFVIFGSDQNHKLFASPPESTLPSELIGIAESQ